MSFASYSLLEQKYLETVRNDIYKDILSFASDVQNYFEILHKKKKVSRAYTKHTDRVFEWTTHPSQTWDTFAKQLRREAKREFFDAYLLDQKNGFVLRSQNEWLHNFAESFSYNKSLEIVEECRKRLFSLSNAKIPAHSGMTPELLQKVPNFFRVFSRYEELSGWQQEEKAEEKNISFMAFLDEEKISQVYIDERWESVQAAKKMFYAGEEKYYLWIDFDGAKRPDGIMISIFAHMLIEEINSLGQGISEQEFIEKDSLFTLTERESNREIVKIFERVDTAIYALTRQMASDKKYSQNPVCISQMEALKNRRKLYLRKIMKIRNTVITRLQAKNSDAEIFSLSENIHFIPRFDPLFVTVLRKSELGTNLKNLSQSELQVYKTVSHIIDQVILINSLSFDRVCQIILAQAEKADDLIIIDNFLEKKIERWREEQSQFCAPNPIKHLSLCPLLESEYTATPENVAEFLDDLWKKYGKKGGEKEFSQKFPEMFFAGSDLSKSIGTSSGYLKTWECALVVENFNKKYTTDIVVKLGSGESYFRQNGFLDPKYKELIWKDDLSGEEQDKIFNTLGEKYSHFQKSPSGLLSLLQKSPWLNSITLQSKAREWIFEMSPSQLHFQLKDIYEQKEKNIKNIKENALHEASPSLALQDFCDAEKKQYQFFIGNEKDANKTLDSYASLVEIFAIELTPVLRDRSLKRSESQKLGESENYLQEQGKQLSKKLQECSGINSRAIAGNTASSFLFPLGILGKGTAFHAIAQKYSAEEVKAVVAYWEPEELLQVIRQYSVIASHVFHTLKISGLEKLSEQLAAEWSKIQNIIPVLVEIIEEKIFSENFNSDKKAELVSLYSSRFRSLLDYNTTKKEWNFSSDALHFLEENWQKNAQKIIAKSANFLSGENLEYPFSKEDIATWDRFMTMQCRMRGDTGLLG